MASLVAVVLVMTMVSGVALADEAECKAAVLSLSPCLNYITGRSSPPSSACCLQLRNVVQSQPWCLCYGLTGDNSNLGLPIIPVNETLALALPGACNVQTPPPSGCKEFLPPGRAMTPLPAPTLTTVNDIPSAGTKSNSTNGSTSNGNMTKFPIHMTLFLLFITSSVSAIIAI